MMLKNFDSNLIADNSSYVQKSISISAKLSNEDALSENISAISPK